MNTTFWQNFVPCLGWTFVHFLWQGISIAIVLAVALRCCKPSSANLRYACSCLAMLLLAVAPFATFSHGMRVAAMSLHDSDGITASPAKAQHTTQAPSAEDRIGREVLKVPPKPIAWRDRLEMAIPWLASFWIFGVVLTSTRLLVGWWHLRRIKRSASTLVGGWSAKCATLAGRLRLNRIPPLLQSALIEVPAVIGWLRPVILLPVGCFAGMSPSQIEAILAHEVAHIRRNDYLVNLLQSAVETLLFYHPAVWWVSRNIRMERENCCDDLAVKICGDRVAYARALAILEELRHTPQFVIAANGSPLLPRIRRLVGRTDAEFNRSPWPAAALICGLAVTALTLFARGENARAANPTPKAVQTQPSGNASNAPTQPNASHSDSTERRIVSVKMKIAEIDITQSPDLPIQILKQLGGAAIQNEEPVNVLNPPFGIGPSNNAVWLSSTNFATNQFWTILAPDKSREVIKALEQRAGVDILTAPQVTSRIGMRAQIQVANIQTIVTGINPTNNAASPNGFNYLTQNLPIGTTVDLVPTSGLDEFTIGLDASCSISEFLGYDKPKQLLLATNANGSVISAGLPSPLFRVRQLQSPGTSLVYDGQTLVLGAICPDSIESIKNKTPVLGDIPVLGRLFVSTRSHKSRKCLLVFITPTLIKDDGTLVHSEQLMANPRFAAPPEQ